MRSDMPKILVERPRYGGNARMRRYKDHENAPRTESMKKRWKGWLKSLNENLKPLSNFLGSRVNRPWDKVYSEIRENLSPNSAIHMHILEHLYGMVELHVTMIDKKPYHLARWNRMDNPVPLYSHGTWPRFYVHPETGMLRKAPNEPRYRGHRHQPATFKVGKHEYAEIGGIWYRVSAEHADFLRKYDEHNGTYSKVQLTQLEIQEGLAKYAKPAHKRQIGGKELQMVKLATAKKGKKERANA